MDEAISVDVRSLSEGGAGDDPAPNIRSEARIVMQAMDRCHVHKIPIPIETAEAGAKIVGELMLMKSTRRRALGASLMLKMLQYNLAVFVKADEQARLNTGNATENVQHVFPQLRLQARGPK